MVNPKELSVDYNVTLNNINHQNKLDNVAEYIVTTDMQF